MRLEGKTAIVTGAGSGFGAGIARRFAAEGATVMVVDLNGDAAGAVAREIGGVAQVADVSKADSVKDMAQAALAAWGRIDILVNNAGITHLPKPLETVTEDEFDLQFSDIFDQINAYADGAPIHMINPEAWTS